eukprot:11404029-Ditylum_brightwellii.AAC.1
MGQNNPEPQAQWDSDFIAFLLSIPSTDEIVIGFDANTSRQNEKLGEIMNSRDLKDLISTKHGEHTPPTFTRGRTTIDHVFVTQRLPNACPKSGISPPNKYLLSDHRGIYVDMKNSLAFGGLNYDLRQRRK